MFRNAEQHDRANTELSKLVDLTSQRVDSVLHDTWKRRDWYRVGHALSNKERSNEILNVYSGFRNKVSHRRRRTKSPRTMGRKRCGIKSHDPNGTSTGRRRHICESFSGQLKYLTNLSPASLGRITEVLFRPQKGSKSVLSWNT